MLNFGLSEMLIIGLFVLLFVGPDRLPMVLRFLGKQYGKLRSASNELRRAFTIEADKAEAEARAERLRERREEARQKHEALLARARSQALESEQTATSDASNGPAEALSVPADNADDIAIPIASDGLVPDQRHFFDNEESLNLAVDQSSGGSSQEEDAIEIAELREQP